MKNFNIDKCTYCGSRNLGEGTQNGYAAITVKDCAFKSAKLCYIICADCGSVVRIFVDKPKKFMPKSD